MPAPTERPTAAALPLTAAQRPARSRLDRRERAEQLLGWMALAAATAGAFALALLQHL